MKFNEFLKESTSKVLIVVDIQPEYKNYFKFSIHSFCDWINENSKNYSKVIFLFNGEDTLGMISQSDLQLWYFENGLEQDVIESAAWYDKGYAFFRYCIDNSIDDDDIVELIQFMHDNNIYDSRDITESSLWDEFEQKYNKKELRELLEFSNDNINLPDLMDFLSKFKGYKIDILGGGKNECLKEVQIALKANNQSYTEVNQWIYEGRDFLNESPIFDDSGKSMGDRNISDVTNDENSYKHAINRGELIVEKSINGLIFKIFKIKSSLPGYMVRVFCLNSDNKVIGILASRQIQSLPYPKITSVHVDEIYQSNKIGKTFYLMLMENFGGIVSDTSLTGQEGFGSFNIWKSLSSDKKYFSYIINYNFSNDTIDTIEEVDVFQRYMIGNRSQLFCLSTNKLMS